MADHTEFCGVVDAWKCRTFDVLEVVRCKDCIFNNGLLEFGDLQCGLLGVPMKNDDFCSYGERK